VHIPGRSLVVVCLLVSCKSVTIDMTNLACQEDGCLLGYDCHPFDELCVPEIAVGCVDDGDLCPSSVSDGTACPSAGSFIPCDDSATDCSAGCRTCGDDGLWGPCQGGSGCTLGLATTCATCDDDCLVGVRNAAAIFCDTSSGTNQCAYSDCLPGYQDADGVRTNGCECQIPGSTEICDGDDNDCNGTIDDVAASNLTSQCETLVSGTSHVSTWSCEAAACAVATGDCDTGWWDINGEASDGCEYECTPAGTPTEICNGEDEDCNGVDDDVVDLKTDCDGQVNNPQNVTAWECPDDSCEILTCAPGWTNGNENDDDGCETECTPDLPERCNDEDDDCNGITDDPDAQGCTTYYRDEDRDGVGLLSDSACLCETNGIYDSTQTDDCDDSNPDALPGGTEVCDVNDVDEDCDGGADDADPEGATGGTTHYTDGDDDGFGDENAAGAPYCDAGANLSTTNDDCDDVLGTVNPGAEESLSTVSDTCNDGHDNDCDDLTDILDPGCGGDAWWDCAFSFRRRIVLHNEQVVADQANFPVLISLPNDGDLAADAQDNGNDIAFASEDGATQYSHEIETFDGGNGTLVAWVKVPVLSGSVDTILYLYYGASGGSQEDVAAVWSNGYEAVYHLHDDFDDSTGSHNASNSNSVDVAGQMADGQEVEPNDGSPDHVDLGTWSVTGDQLTIQAWMRVEAWTRNDGRVISKADGDTPEEHVFMLSTIGADHRLRLRIKTGTNNNSGTTSYNATSGDIGLGTWYLAAGTYDGTTMRLLLDGIDAGSTGKTGDLRDNGWDIWSGDNPGVSRELDGTLDELRVSSAARDATWLRTEYNNQFTPATFHTIEAEDARPATCP